MKKFKVPIIILFVLLAIGYSRYNALFKDYGILSSIKEDYTYASIPIKIDNTLPANMCAHFYYEYATDGTMKYFDPSSFVVKVKSEYASDNYILAHEFGHFIGIVYFDNTTEEFADSYAYYYIDKAVSGNDKWILDTKLTLEGRQIYEKDYFEKLLMTYSDNPYTEAASYDSPIEDANAEMMASESAIVEGEYSSEFTFEDGTPMESQ